MPPPEYKKIYEILNPKDAIILESQNLAGPVKNGRRELSRSAAISEDTVSSLDSGYGGEPVAPAPPVPGVPFIFESQATLMFVGLNECIAQIIFADWETANASEGFSDTFESFTIIQIDQLKVDEDDWNQALTNLGVSDELQEAIMKPEFEQIRLTNSPKCWVLDSIDLRFLSLRHIWETSEGRQAMREEGYQAKDSNEKQKEQEDKTKKPKPSPKKGKEADDLEVASAFANVLLESTPGYVTLWKGIASLRLRRNSDGSVDLTSLISSDIYGPYDFKIKGVYAYYFSVQPEVAISYAKFAINRSALSNQMLVKMVVPNKTINRMKPVVLSFDDTWKQIIYCCRGLRKNMGGVGSQEFKHLAYIHNRLLIIGPICGGLGHKWGSWKDISEKDLYKFTEATYTEDGKMQMSKDKKGKEKAQDDEEACSVVASQHVFQGTEAEVMLYETATLEAFPVSKLLSD